VLSKSASSAERSKAYSLLITATRASQGYNAAIRKAEGIRASLKKSKRPSQELRTVNQLISDLTQRRNAYLRTISEQRKVIQAHPGSDRAAQAALKIAQCKQAIGSRTEAISAYLSMMKDYPLTRPGWKAAQEVAWLRSVDKDHKANGRKDLDAQLQSIADKSDFDQARKLAWDMACGNKDFTPSYSDVLRLEAIVADLAPKSTAPAENAITAKVPAATDEEAVASPKDDGASIAQGKPKLAPRRQPNSHTASNYAPTVPQMGGLSFSGTIGNTGNTGTKSTTKPGSHRKNTPGTTAPVVTPEPVEPAPVVEQPNVPVPNPLPIQPIDPPFTQWTCAKEYRELAAQPEQLDERMSINMGKASRMLDSPNPEHRHTGLGVMLGAAMCASQQLGNNEQAIGICEKFILPNLDAADKDQYKYLSKTNVLDRVASIYAKAGQYEQAVSVLKSMLDDESTGNIADSVRIRLAHVLEQLGKLDEAIGYLSEIDDSGDVAGAKEYITELEKKLEESGKR
ncbi:tetratricopeptide repeat protein, partial [bacterium]|nr:tetratricopeptide repeat protein [bacterium]